jgi:uncharacterized protein with ATP-grasp and redox domains
MCAGGWPQVTIALRAQRVHDKNMKTTRQTLKVLRSLLNGPQFINLHTKVRLQKMGLVESADPGKSLDAKLTEKGREVASA